MSRAPRSRRQSGVAAITAVLIVAVAASAATLMLAQQAATLDQAMLVASRAQADQYALAGLDWARGVLAQDSRDAPLVDSLDEGWAQPIAGLPVERAVVAGAIEDEQGRFNLNNLVSGGNQQNAAEVEVFRRLLASQGLAPELADAVVDWIDFDSDLASGSGAEDAFYLALPRPYRAANAPMTQVEELYRVRGFDAKAVALLKPLVTALGERTRVNANTASEAVLAALLPRASAAQVAAIVTARRARAFRATSEVAALAGKESAAAVGEMLDVKSAYFSIRVTVSQDDVQLATEALVRRGSAAAASSVPAILWRRPRY
jgi:general secretion pathway protein K